RAAARAGLFASAPTVARAEVPSAVVPGVMGFVLLLRPVVAEAFLPVLGLRVRVGPPPQFDPAMALLHLPARVQFVLDLLRIERDRRQLVGEQVSVFPLHAEDHA